MLLKTLEVLYNSFIGCHEVMRGVKELELLQSVQFLL